MTKRYIEEEVYYRSNRWWYIITFLLIVFVLSIENKFMITLTMFSLLLIVIIYNETRRVKGKSQKDEKSLRDKK